MTTTELIEILQKVEKGASGRSREISLYIEDENEVDFIPSPDIKLNSTGDGCLGAELTLMVTKTNI